MSRILFPCLDVRATTGARYAESLMRDALSKSHQCTILDGSAAPWSGSPLFGLIPALLGRFYDLVVTSDNYLIADLLYVQPHAGGDVQFPWIDTMTFRASSSVTSGLLRLMAPIARATYRTATLLSNSDYTRSLLLSSISRDSGVLYPPVPTYLYDAKGRERGDEIITLSSLNPRKNLQAIPSTAAALKGHRFGLIGYAVPEHLTILVDLHRRFAQDAPECAFRYYGSSTDSEKAEILSRTKAYLHPTIAEPFGIAVAEAMAAGCIPVVHDSGGVTEFVPKEWRYSTPQEAADLLKKALGKWNPRIADEMRSIALSFREEVFIERFLDHVDQALKTRRA